MSSTHPPAQNSATLSYGRWGIALLLPLIVGIWTSFAGFDTKIVLFSCLTITALAIWALELLPDAVVAAVLPVLYIVTNVGQAKQILSPWSSSIGWLILGGLVTGAFMMQTGLARRLALRCMQLMGGSFQRLLWGILLAGVVMAPFIPSVLGRSAILVVICVGICEALSLEKGSREGAAIMLAGFVAVAGPKLAFLTGGADLAMGMKLAGQVIGTPVSWMEYALHNFVPAMLYSALSIGCILVVLRPRLDSDIRKVVTEQLQTLGVMSTNERKAMALLATLLLFMVTDQYHGIDIGWIMLLVSCTAFLPGINLLNQESFSKLNFSSVFFVVGCMTIGAGAIACGVDKLLAGALLPMLQGSETYTVLASYGAGVALNLLLTPLAAYAALTTSVVEIAQQLGVHPLLVMYSYNYGLDQYLFPYEYAILLYFYSTGYPKIGQVVQVFGLRLILGTLFLVGVAYPFWKWVL